MEQHKLHTAAATGAAGRAAGQPLMGRVAGPGIRLDRIRLDEIGLHCNGLGLVGLNTI